MSEQSGRSLIEVIGVMAIAGIMTISALGVYNMIRANQVRTIASAELKQIAENTKILMEMRNSYSGLSVDYLIKAGALKSDRAPLGGVGWSVGPTSDASGFEIRLVDLTSGECEYFATSRPTWAASVVVNGFPVGVTDGCFDSDTNQVTFVVE